MCASSHFLTKARSGVFQLSGHTVRFLGGGKEEEKGEKKKKKRRRQRRQTGGGDAFLTVNRQEIHRRVVPEERLPLAPGPRPPSSRVGPRPLRVERVRKKAFGADRQKLPPLLPDGRRDGRGPVSDGGAAAATAGLVDEVLFFGRGGDVLREREKRGRKT